MAETPSKVLVSACLLGQPVRFDGQSKPVEHTLLHRWQQEGRLVPVCPEVSGGLPVPRAAAEIDGLAEDVLTGRTGVKTEDHEDVGHFFVNGAQHALRLCKQQNIHIAILKENSPSCGSSMIYDGNFNNRLVPGSGITTSLLRQNGIRVFSEHEIGKAACYVDAGSGQ